MVGGPLGAIDQVEAPLAACTDLHAPSFALHPHYRATVNMCRKLGFDASACPLYFNSGVLLVKDTPANHSFFQAWQKNYSNGFAAGIRPDQPSLAQTNAQMGNPVQPLPDVWNCQVQNGVRYLKDALIVHYMVTNVASGQEGTLYALNRKDLLLEVRKEGLAPVQDILDHPLAGYAPFVRVFAGEDLYFFQTRRYKWLRKKYRPGKFSFLEWLLKVKDHLLKRL